VTEPVWCDVFLNTGCLANSFYGQSYFASPQPVSMRGKQEIIRFLRWTLGYPFIEELLYLGMKRDVSVVMHFTQRDAQPVVFTDLDHAISSEVKEFTLTHPGQYESDSAESHKQAGMISGCL